MSFPGTFGFVGEFLIVLGLGINNFQLCVCSFIGIFLSVFYSFWFYNRVCCFVYKSFFFFFFSDLSFREIIVVFILSFFILFFGFFPNFFIIFIELFLVNNLFSVLLY